MVDEEERIIKCDPMAGKRCWSIERRLALEANHGKGFVLFVLTSMNMLHKRDLDAKAYWVAGINYREKARDAGVLINFCPWCGTDVSYERWIEARNAKLIALGLEEFLVKRCEEEDRSE